MGFRDYYRQFEEMAPEEISAELLARRDERRRKALTKIDPLDLSGTTWHEPPHPDAVNAATFALRRAVNEPPDLAASALREALAARHGVGVEQVVAGHGAGELLRALLGRVVRGGEALIGWPGLAAAAGAGRGRRRPRGAGRARAGGAAGARGRGHARGDRDLARGPDRRRCSRGARCATCARGCPSTPC